MRIETRAVLFDSDGVLIDSHHHVADAWKSLAYEFSLDFDVLIGELVGVPAAATLARHLPPPQARQAVSRLEDLEVEMAAAVKPIPGALRLLDQLPDGSWTVVTSASRRLAEARWRSAGLSIPRQVITADDVTTGKPNPEPYQAAARLLGEDPSQCVVFEDSSAGGIAGDAAGATVVAVGDQPWSTHPAARVSSLSQVAVQQDGALLTLAINHST